MYIITYGVVIATALIGVVWLLNVVSLRIAARRRAPAVQQPLPAQPVPNPPPNANPANPQQGGRRPLITGTGALLLAGTFLFIFLITGGAALWHYSPGAVTAIVGYAYPFTGDHATDIAISRAIFVSALLIIALFLVSTVRAAVTRAFGWAGMIASVAVVLFLAIWTDALTAPASWFQSHYSPSLEDLATWVWARYFWILVVGLLLAFALRPFAATAAKKKAVTTGALIVLVGVLVGIPLLSWVMSFSGPQTRNASAVGAPLPTLCGRYDANKTNVCPISDRGWTYIMTERATYPDEFTFCYVHTTGKPLEAVNLGSGVKFREIAGTDTIRYRLLRGRVPCPDVL